MESSFAHCFFFFNNTATTEIYTLSLRDALPICAAADPLDEVLDTAAATGWGLHELPARFTIRTDAEAADRKSTRLNSSHANISYAVFCLKKKQETSVSQVESHQSENHFPPLHSI